MQTFLLQVQPELVSNAAHTDLTEPVLRISSDRDDQRIFWGWKILACIFWGSVI